MGIGGVSVTSLLVILLIVILLFGTKKLRGMGTDLGGAIKSFKKAVRDEEAESEAKKEETEQRLEQSETEKTDTEGRVIEGESSKEKEKS